MKMSDLPALPKTKKPLNRQLYATAWAPFAVFSGLLGGLFSQAKAGFLLSALLTLVALALSFSNNALTADRYVFLGLGFAVMGVVFSVVLSLLSGLSKFLR